MSLRSRIFLSTNAVFLAGFVVLIASTSLMLDRFATKSGSDYLNQTASTHAKAAAAIIAEGQLASQNGAFALQAMLSAGVTDRAAYAGVMRTILGENPDFVGAGMVFEPDVIGKDGEHAGQGFSDDKGQLVPYFSHSGADVAYEPLLMTAEGGVDDWYYRARDTKRITMTEPYLYPVNGVDVLMATASSPVIDQQGKAVGGTTIDIPLSGLTDLLNNNLEYKTAAVTLISAGGLWVAHPDKTKLGTKIDSTTAGELAQLNGAEKILENDGMLIALKPFKLMDTGDVWFTRLTVDQAEVMAVANQTSSISILIGCLFLAAGFVIFWFLGRSISGPVINLAERMKALASGDVNVDIPHSERKDEIGLMAGALKVFCRKRH